MSGLLLQAVLLFSLAGFSQSQSSVPVINGCGPLALTLSETTPLNEFLGDLDAYDPDGESIIYEIFGDGGEFFNVDRNTGRVILKKLLDFESLQKLTTTLRVTDADGQSTGRSCVAIISDENDEFPLFTNVISARISEAADIGYELPDILAITDIDTENAVITVECKPDTENRKDACETFKLRPVERSNEYYRGRIELIKKLDYERRKSYILLYEAFDGLNRMENEVHIIVLDVNDSPPQWERINPASIPEEEPIGTLITRVTATDPDVFEKRDIAYELIGEHTDVFNINNLTGIISNARRLDFDAPDSRKDKPFEIKIKAREIIRESDGTTRLGDDPATTATIDITVTMQDINDNSPEFVENGLNKTNYIAYINEDIADDQNVPGLLMTVIDRDQTTNFNTFALLTDGHTETFGIIPTRDSASTSPAIYVKPNANIDYESDQKEYVILVTAPETLTSPAFTGSATVTIVVRDVNDETPQFATAPIEIDVIETKPGGSPLRAVTATDREKGIFGQAGIRYKLYGNIRNHFAIDERTGQLSIADCDTPGQDPCINYEVKKRYALTVVATDNEGINGRTNTKEVIINILDDNDNPPVMEQSFLRSIYEEQTVPINPLIIEAQDPDTIGGPVQYRISGDSTNLWQITTGRYPNSNNDYANITAVRKIKYNDAPNQDTGEFKFNVVAYDQKESSTAQVTIRVLDINNNAPRFTSSIYRGSLSETSLGEVSLLQVAARDADSPTTDNGVIDFAIRNGGVGKFQLKNRQLSDDGRTFVMDVFTTPDAVFNFEKQNVYIMTLECRDRGSPTSLTGTTLVRIVIRDANNVLPVIVPISVTINVREDTPIGTSVHRVDAEDPDTEKDLHFFMEASEASQPTGAASVVPFRDLFEINEINGDVLVKGKLNRDEVSFITNELRVEDRGSDVVQTGIGALYIRITEFNDQDPEFVVPFYNVSLQEEKTRNSVVRALECTDEDDKIADYFIFQTEPRFPQYFTLFSDSGLVIVNNRIDYEKVEFITLTVTCVDTGEPQRSASTSFYVYVENINDNSPIFEKDFYQGTVTEGTYTSDAYLQTVKANDIDKGDFGEVRYRLSKNDPYFDIDSLTGEIFVKTGATFDRENNPRYDLQVVAYDSPLNETVRRESFVPVYITIDDINDNCPRFMVDRYSYAIPESFERGTTIVDIVATDQDIGPNGEVQFAIQIDSGEPQGVERLFSIISRDGYGRLMTSTPLRDRVGIMTFNVTATDMSPVNPCTSTVPVSVEVKESQNDAPEWIRPPKRDWVIYVLESQYNGMLVYHAKAHDSNEGPNGVVDYFFHINNQFVPNTNEFRINRVTGVIRADVVFDREQVDRYFLTLMARDQGTPSASSETTLTVIILDVDDNDPKFNMKDGIVVPLNLFVAENEVPQNGDLYLGNCSHLASDADSDVKNNKIYYKMLTTSSEIQDHIYIDRETCSIFLKKSVDYETQTTLEFDILAYNEKNDDSVIRYQKREVNPSILPVVINIVDTNDNEPVFTESMYLACASVDSSYRETILQVEATDPDQGDTANIRYSLKTETDTFGIMPVLGTIYNKVSFRYGNQGRREYSIEVQAEDPNGNLGTASVRILVSDSSNLVKLRVNRPRVDVEPFRQLIISSIKANSNGKIDFACIDSITNHVDDDGEETTSSSDVYLMAAWVPSPGGAYETIPAGELAAMIAGMMEAEDNKLRDIYVTKVEEKGDSDDWEIEEDVVLIIFIICILLIVLAIILLCLACYCIRRSKRRKVRKLKAERHTIVAQQPGAASVNPVYMMGVENDEYATVQKVRPSTQQQGPIAPVVIPAPENLQPLSSEAPTNLEPAEPVVVSPPEEPEPFIETEVLPDSAPGQEGQPRVLEHPEYEDTIVTTVVDDEPKSPAAELVEQPSTSGPEPEPYLPQSPVGEGEIEVEIKDTPPASPDSTRKGGD